MSHCCLPKYCSSRDCKLKLIQYTIDGTHGDGDKKNSLALEEEKEKNEEKNFLRDDNLKFWCAGKVKARRKKNPTTVSDVQMNWPYSRTPANGNNEENCGKKATLISLRSFFFFVIDFELRATSMHECTYISIGVGMDWKCWSWRWSDETALTKLTMD